MILNLRMKRCCTLIIFVALIFTDCKEHNINKSNKNAITNDNSQEEYTAIPSWGAYIKWGVPPWSNKKTMKKYFAPLLEYLSENLKRNIKLHISKNYQNLRKNLKTNTIQFATFSPSALAIALTNKEFKGQIKYIATYARKSSSGKIQDFYQGYIFTRADSKFRMLSDLKKQRFAFVEKQSASGYVYPMAVLLNRGIRPNDFFSKKLFMGKHSRVMEAIYSKEAAAGATWDAEYNSAINKEKYGEQAFRIIARTPPIPNDAVVVLKKYRKNNKELVLKLKKLLISLNLNSKTKSGNLVFNKNLGFPYSGFVQRNFNFYNVILDTLKVVEIYQAPENL